MVALLDVSMLIAMLDEAHVHHQKAHAWMAVHGFLGWASCGVTQNGCVRIMTQSVYPGGHTVASVAGKLRTAMKSTLHTLWADSISITDEALFHNARILTGKHLTELYLLALAVKKDGRLVTFDRGIPVSAVVGARAEHLVVL